MQAPKSPPEPAQEPARAAPLQGMRSLLSQDWPRYRQDGLADDMAAALVVALLLIPQNLAYALLGGLDPVVGIMASLLPALAYAAFGSSSTLGVGPVAVLAMMTAQAIGPVAQTHGVSPHLVALVLALEMAAIFAVAAWLRLDVFAALLSVPVLHGFVTGASIVIALAQVPQLLGWAVRGNTLSDLLRSAAALPHWAPHATTAFIGITALLSLVLLRRYGAALLGRLGLAPARAKLLARMAPVAVVAGAILWILLRPGSHAGVTLAGQASLVDGLHFPAPWQAPAGVWWALLGPACLLGLVAYVQSLAVAETLAARRAEKVSAQRELWGLAGANAAAAFTGGMPVAGGLARSTTNFDAGARTRMAGVWTVGFLVLAMLLLDQWLKFLPRAVLSATIIVSVLSLLDFKPFARALRYSKPEFGLMLLVALITVVWGVERALAVGVVCAAGLLLQRTARPHWAEVGRLPGTEIYRNVKRFEVQTWPSVLSVRVDESLLFTNSRWLSETLGAAPQQRPALRHIVLMMSGVNDIDFTGLEELVSLAAELQRRGVLLHLSELKGPVSDRLLAAGLNRWLTGKVYRTQHDAHQALAPDSAPS